MSDSHLSITFGTDGWRAIIADGFTFDSVRLMSRAMAVAARRIVAPEDIDRGRIVVGYDRRFLSAEFAREVATELALSGYHVLLSNRPTPSQTISHAVWTRKVIGGIVVTASHNPAVYNGLKFKGWYGGSALPSIYAEIARHLGTHEYRDGGSVESVDILGEYIDSVRSRVDVETIRRSDIRILHDPIHGASAGVPALVLGDEVAVETIRGEVNPSFGGVNPEPIPENLAASFTRIGSSSDAGGPPAPDLAICNDGDADRLGVIDESGRFVSPQKIISLLTLDLIRRKGRRGEVVKTFSTTRLIERIGRALGVQVHETPIGFKYVVDLMLAREILIGGEESGGIGFGDFLPERDGILSGLLVAEAVAASGRSLSSLVRDMEGEFGACEYDRRDIRVSMDRCESLIRRVRSGELDSKFDATLSRREEVDGVKLSFEDDSWLLFRRSGTEPLIRIYCEAGDAGRVREMLDIAEGEL